MTNRLNLKENGFRSDQNGLVIKLAAQCYLARVECLGRQYPHFRRGTAYQQMACTAD